jgi:hypothetical protein
MKVFKEGDRVSHFNYGVGTYVKAEPTHYQSLVLFDRDVEAAKLYGHVGHVVSTANLELIKNVQV